MKRYRLLTETFVILVLLLSCKKNGEIPAPIIADPISIDSATVVSFININVSVSLHTTMAMNHPRFGICWSKTENPTATRDTLFQPNNSSVHLDTTIKNLDSNTLYHLRAFYITDKDTVYSSDTAIKTGGLSTVFEKEYPGNGYPDIKQIFSEGNNGFIVLTQVNPEFSGGLWSRLTKIDIAGNEQWVYDYDLNEDKQPDLLLTETDGYVFSAHLNGPGVRSAILYKTSIDGKLLWEKQFTDSIWTTQYPGQLYEDNNSNIVMTLRGRRYEAANGTYTLGPLLIYHIDQTGNLAAATEYVDIMNSPSPIVLTSGFTETGYLAVLDTTRTNYGFILEKFSSSNVVEWNKTFLTDGLSDYSAFDCQEDIEGNYTVLASTAGPGNIRNSWLFGVDKKDGSMLWQNIYEASEDGYPVYTYPLSFTRSSQNNYYVTGFVQGSPFILKCGAQGRYIWDYVFTYAPDAGGEGYKIFVYPDNVIYLFTFKGSQSNNKNMFLTKLQEY